jgi:hypothetical protein
MAWLRRGGGAASRRDLLRAHRRGVEAALPFPQAPDGAGGVSAEEDEDGRREAAGGRQPSDGGGAAAEAAAAAAAGEGGEGQPPLFQRRTHAGLLAVRAACGHVLGFAGA